MSRIDLPGRAKETGNTPLGAARCSDNLLRLLHVDHQSEAGGGVMSNITPRALLLNALLCNIAICLVIASCP